MAACPNCGQNNPESARFCHACATLLAAAPGAAQEVRKTVTVVFCDVIDSTPLGERLDPELLRRVMSRFFDEMRAALEAHGGTVEKFIGDAVMAVFGVPRLHEDDALRAARAAVEMRERLAALNEELRGAYGVELEMRVGINTGPVVAGGLGALTLATGNAVNLAKRLEEVAAPGEILIGAETHRLVRDEVDADLLESFSVKGKREEVAAWRLQELRPTAETAERRTPLVDREADLRALLEAFDDAVADNCARLVTVFGSAGIGKSRLACELLDRLGDRATSLTGRCLPYGDGITFWPLAEMIREAGGEPALRAALADRSDADLVVERVLGATGSAGETGGAEETSWAMRKLVEALAAPQPLVLVFEDIHWAEPTLLDLIEYFAGWIRDAPVLLLCLARPDLVDRRSTWLAPRPNARMLSLDPLTEEETELLLAALGRVGEFSVRMRTKISEAAEGNPLFVEQMAAMLAEEDDAGIELPMPPSIHALLAARLDRLETAERAVIETAAVIGRGFWRGAVRELAPAEVRDAAGTHLMALVRKELVEPEASTLPQEDAFRFRHVLIRDAAYEGMSKKRRAYLHESFAHWLEENAGELASELEEIVGYHLEQAVRLREQLGAADESTRALAVRAADILGAAGRRAVVRSDMPAAINLLGRALELGGEEQPDRHVLLRELSAALWAQGELTRAESILEETLAAAIDRGDRRIEWYARLDRSAHPGLAAAARTELDRVAAEAVVVFDELGDDLGLARAWRGRARAARAACRFEDAQEAAERALRHAEAARDASEGAGIVDLLCTALLYGPAPAKEAAARCAEIAAAAGKDRLLEANVASSWAGLEAMTGKFDAAEALVARAAAVYDELGHRMFRAGLGEVAGPIELLAGRPEAAERELRQAVQILAESGNTALLASPALMLAETLLAQGREDEARHFVEMSKAAPASDDTTDAVLACSVGARLRALEGELADAEAEARRAVELASSTDALVLHGDALALLADVLVEAGRPGEAHEAYERAIELYSQKGNVVAAQRAAEALAAVSQQAPTP
jgi:class 3 adenylate cyclase/tetratricopeptide (TPR) repeat protein